MSQLVHFSNSPEVFRAAERLFAEIESRIRAALPDVEIRHIGSTAIQGSLTKGDLDVLVRVNEDDFRKADRVLAEMFNRNRGSVKTESFSAFSDSAASPELGVQLVVEDQEYDWFTDWLDRLRSDPELRASYDELKAEYHGKKMSDYRAAKNAFISENLQV